MTPQDKNWHSDIEAPLKLATTSNVEWSSESDVIVVGLGGAGVAAALQSIENGLSVIAIDRFEGGGATKASGGVIYAGGGTVAQKEAGVQDTPDNMFNYLKLETEGIISDETLRDFCEKSAPTIDWITSHGVDLRGTLWPHKTSYPAPQYFLYHSDNSLVPSYKKHAAPAARGHRGYVPIKQGAKATNLGGSIFDPLRTSAEAKGLKTLPYTEVRQLVTDGAGKVIGVKALRFSDSETLETYKTLRAKANKLFAMFPPIIPGSKFFFKKAMGHLDKAKTLAASREEIFIDDIAEIDENNVVAIEISLTAKLFPCPTLTLGGLKVDEGTGHVLNDNGKAIDGLYAAGRNAIGVASWNYVSGLSIADCVYSGRRAATSISAS